MVMLDGVARLLPGTASLSFPVIWDKEGSDRILVGGVLGGDVKQFLSGVPNDIIRCSKAWWFPRVVHAAPKRLGPLP
jgi:hypothetical protein